MPDFNTVGQQLTDAADGFKKMQYALLVFAAAVTIGFVVMAVIANKK